MRREGREPPLSAAAAAKLLQSCPTLCDPIDGSHQAPPSLRFSTRGNSRRATWVGPQAERPRFPGPLLRRTRGPDPSSTVQSLSRVRLFATPGTAARQASLYITNSQSLLKLMSTESMMPSNHTILCHPLLLLPLIFPSIRIFSKESVFCIRWPK